MSPYLWRSIRKVYNLPAPSVYQSIHLGNILKLQCLLAHWLQCTFPLPQQMEHWSNHNHSVCYNKHLFRNYLLTSHQSSLLLSTCSSSTKKNGTCSPSEGLSWCLSSDYHFSFCSKFLIFASCQLTISASNLSVVLSGKYLSHSYDLEASIWKKHLKNQ